MHWTDTLDTTLDECVLTPLAEHDDLSFHVKWLEDITDEELSEVERLLKSAYQSDPPSSMWDYFLENIEDEVTCLFFTLKDKNTGQMIGTHSIGEAAWGGEYWDEHAHLVHQETPIAGMALTIDRAYRRRGLGYALWKLSTDWAKERTSIAALFGDTNSRRALEMYMKHGAWFLQSDLDKLYERYNVQTTLELLDTTKDLERLDLDYVLRYLWAFQPEQCQPLADLGYKAQ